MRPLFVVALAAGLVSGEGTDAEKEKKEEKKYVKAADRDLADPGVKIEDSSVARSKLAEFDAAFRREEDEMKRAELVRALGQWDHRLILRKAASLARKKNRFVAVEAVFVCARQGDAKKVGKALHNLLKREKRSDVVCALLVSLGKIGYEKAYKDAVHYFKRDTRDTHRAATRYLGYVRAKQAFRMLAEKLDHPRPKDIDDPQNPPASWWEARYKEWERNRPYTKWAIDRLVEGESFDSTREAKDWAEARGKKHGIKW